MMKLMEKSKYPNDEDEDEAEDEDGNFKNLLCLFIRYVQYSLLWALLYYCRQYNVLVWI